MTEQFLLEIFDKGQYLELICLFLVYEISWMITIKLGFTILQVDIKLKNTIIGALPLSCIALFVKPLASDGIISIFITLIPLLLLLKFYGKSKWRVACWITFISILST
jgi:hypothetical protein